MEFIQSAVAIFYNLVVVCLASWLVAGLGGGVNRVQFAGLGAGVNRGQFAGLGAGVKRWMAPRFEVNVVFNCPWRSARALGRKSLLDRDLRHR
jgi:hypothetical protein